MAAALLDHLWQSTLCAAVIAALAYLLRRNGAHIRYWLWWAASLKFIVPFSLLVMLGSQLQWQELEVRTRSGFDVALQWTDMAASVVQPAGEALHSQLPSALPPGAQERAFDWQLLAGVIWALGSLCVVGIWTLRWLRLQSVLRHAEPLYRNEDRQQIEFPVPVKSAPGMLEPGIVGIWSPVLLLPQGLYERLSPQQLRAILAHELCHLERSDNLTAAVHMAIEAIFWFHPLVWWIGSRLVEERERACDAAVLRAGNDAETYAEGILDVCQHCVAAPLDCVAGVSGADLKKRIRAIMTHSGEVRLHFGKLALMCSVASLIVGVPIAVGAVTAAAPKTRAIGKLDFSTPWPDVGTLEISVSQAAEGHPTGLLINPNGLLTVRNRSLRGLVAFAYGLQSAEVIEVGASARELADTRYDITAKIRAVDADTVFDEQHLKALARRILAEQFRLTFHWDEQRVPVYELTADTTGEQTTKGMRIASDEDPGPLLNLGFNSLTGYAVPMKLLNQYLASRFKQPIVDHTGLKASYNFRLTWGSEPLAATQPADLPPAPEPSIDVLAQALESQLGLRITQEVGNVRRMIVDNLDQAVNLTPTPTEVPMSPKVFDRYVGHYEFPPGRVMTIFRSGEQFFAHPTGQNAVLLTALGETEFYAKAVGAKLNFSTRDGSVTELVLNQNGSEYRMRPLAAAVANERLAKLAERIREKRALPNSEQLLRVYFASLSADRPAYHLMTDPVAAAVRRDWPTAKARFAKIGAIKAIEFTGVSSVGADIYRVSFEHSTSEWRIGLNDVGQIDVLNYRRLAM